MNYRLLFELMKFSESHSVVVTATLRYAAAKIGALSRSKRLITGFE